MKPSQVFVQNVRAVRQKLGWNQKDLSDRVKALGHKLEPVTITKLERGHKVNVTLDEAMAIAAALGVSPAVLLTPMSDWTEPVEITDDLKPMAAVFYAWLRGMSPLGNEDDTLLRYKEVVPVWEQTAAAKDARHLREQVEAYVFYASFGNRQDAANKLKEIGDELVRQERLNGDIERPRSLYDLLQNYAPTKPEGE